MSHSVQGRTIPVLPKWRLAVALASVPGVYLTLIASAVLALAIALGLVGLIAFVAEWMAERTRYAVFPTGGVNPFDWTVQGVAISTL